MIKGQGKTVHISKVIGIYGNPRTNRQTNKWTELFGGQKDKEILKK